MLCKHCHEQIEVGEATKEEPVPGSPGKYWFFHTGCHLDWRANKLNGEVSAHLERLASAARMVH